MNKILILLIMSFGAQINAQNIFPDKFSGCNTDQFSLESDTTIARINNEDFIDAFCSGFNDQTKFKIFGVLSLQIIVDTEGNSCLLSAENKTNISTKKLNLKETIDTKIKWQKPSEKVSAIVILYFEEGNVSLKRFGVNSNIGWHEISDVLPKKPISPKINKDVKTSNDPKIVIDKKTNSVWKLYNTENSVIPYNMSRSVEVDQNGIIWYCTDEGLVKIDGDNWTVLTAKNSPLPSNKYGNTITSGLSIDKQNRVWVESFGKILMYNGEDWIKYDTTNSPLKSVQDISVDKNGVIWFGTFYGLIKFENGIWTKYNTTNSKIPSNNVRQVFLDNQDILWVATESGISKFENSQWTVFNTNNSLLPSNSVACVNGDSFNNIWIGTNEENGKGGLVKIDKDGNWYVFTKENSKLPTNTIWEIEIENNVIWLGLNNGGLVRLENNHWEIYNTFNSIIPHDYVCSIAIDKNGNKWIATFGGLVFTTR